MSKYLDKMSRYRTQSLFMETNNSSETPVFTLKPRDHNSLPSMKLLYLEASDPTEYKFAMEVLGSWDHWQKLSNAEWFKPHLEQWRDELETKLRSEGVEHLQKLAKSGNKDAAKWLAEGQWDKKRAGRPSRKEVEGHLKQRALLATETEEDAARIGLIKH